MSTTFLGQAFLVLYLATLALSQQYLIVQNSQSSCHTCFTLDQLAQTDFDNGANLTLTFKPGEHTLTRLFSIRNIAYLQMIGQNTSMLTFLDSGWIELSDIDQLRIESLSFVGHATSHQWTLSSHCLSIKNISKVSINNCYISGLGTHHTNALHTNVSVIKLKSTASATIQNVLFDHNNATTLSINDAGSVRIENSTFTGNQGGDGGAVYIDLVNETVTIDNCIFTDNTAAENGGAIYVESGEVYIIHSILRGNSADSGGMRANSGNILFYDITLRGNKTTYGGGIAMNVGNVSVFNSTMKNNTATYGGGIAINLGTTTSACIHVYKSTLSNNTAISDGGGIYISSGNASLYDTTLTQNSAIRNGGGIAVHSSTVSVYSSIFTANIASIGGGIYVNQSDSTLSVYNSTLSNTAYNGGAGIYMASSSASIYDSTLTGNTVFFRFGGGIYLQESAKVSVYNSTLSNNTTYTTGGGIYVIFSTAYVFNSTFINNSAGKNGGGIFMSSSNAAVYNSTFICNNASEGSAILLFNSKVHFNGPTLLSNNYAREFGGAIEATQSIVYFSSELTVTENTAGKYGGGVFLLESNLFINCPVTISHNTALKGGAIYAYQSTIEFNNTLHGKIANNVASNSGGGIYATGSIIKISNSFVYVGSNTANGSGGGFHLQQNSRLYILKKEWESLTDIKVKLTLSNNIAQLGGGIYVDDNTSGGEACSFRPNKGESGFLGQCFIQTINQIGAGAMGSNTINTFITHNTAVKSGSAIYGGLLDRCTVSPSTELLNVANGLEYIMRTVHLPTDEYSISSDPLQVELCNGSQSMFAEKGQPFQIYVKALDQARNPVNAVIHGAVVTNSGIGRLKEGQVKQRVRNQCTELEYNVFSEDSSAQVELYAIGPCTNKGLSKLLLTVTFLNCTCPVGFHPSYSDIECSCECDPKLDASECFPDKETFQLDNALWVGVTHFRDCTVTEYLVHNCPFDYCVDQPVNISLNSSQQIDKQCAYNRSGVLCGKCAEERLGLVFASSKCKECSNIYLLLLIPFAAAGVALVVFILWLNITIATGTVYGLVFYANVLAANKAIFLPFKAPNFLTVFVSWVNLDLGIETCFYDGMNSQAKVLLQIAFPAYLFLLIFLIIILSKYINSFAKVLSNRNPVAALCTLIILSYSKLLRLIIAALQFTSLECSDGSYKLVWLYDGNVQYFSISHTSRFVAAAVILIACVLFTTLLSFGQWFPRCSKWKVMKWTKNTKYIGFMDAFHAPFTPKHRYWPGLLLFALIAHNLAASMAQGTSVPVLSTGCVAVGMIVYKTLMNRLYRNRLNNALENLFLLNVAILALGTFAVKNSSDRQLALANVSLAIAFVFFVVITCYHFYKYVLKKTNIWNNQVRPLNPARRINFNHFRRNQNYKQLIEIDDDVDIELPPVADIYSYGQGPREETDPDKYITPPIIRPATRPDQLREPDLDILAPITEDDYRQAIPIPQAENCPRPVITSTIVEINKP